MVLLFAWLVFISVIGMFICPFFFAQRSPSRWLVDILRCRKQTAWEFKGASDSPAVSWSVWTAPESWSGEDRRGLVVSRKHCQASSLMEQFMVFSYFTGGRSRVWEGDTGNIAYDSGLHGRTSGGLKAACVSRPLAQSLGIVQSFRHVPPYTEPESSPRAITNQSDSTRSGAIYGRLSIFSCDLLDVVSCSPRL